MCNHPKTTIGYFNSLTDVDENIAGIIQTILKEGFDISNESCQSDSKNQIAIEFKNPDDLKTIITKAKTCINESNKQNNLVKFIAEECKITATSSKTSILTFGKYNDTRFIKLWNQVYNNTFTTLIGSSFKTISKPGLSLI